MSTRFVTPFRPGDDLRFVPAEKERTCFAEIRVVVEGYVFKQYLHNRIISYFVMCALNLRGLAVHL